MLHKNSFGACTLNSHLGWSKVFQRWYARITSALRDFPREWERVKSFWLCTPISIMQLRVELKLHPTLVKDQNTMRQNINTKVFHFCQKISLSIVRECCGKTDPTIDCPNNYNMVITSKVRTALRSNWKSNNWCKRVVMIRLLTYFQFVQPLYKEQKCINASQSLYRNNTFDCYKCFNRAFKEKVGHLYYG